jgi:CBS domain-containing protein
MATEQLALIEKIKEMCTGNDVVYQPPGYAQDIMTKEVRALTLDHTAAACIKLMKILGVRHIPIVDTLYEGDEKSYFAGIVSQRDVLRIIPLYIDKPGGQETDKRALRQLLAQIVERKSKVASPESPIPEVITIMLDNHIDMVPIIVAEEVVGVITTTDILRVFLKLTIALDKLYPDKNDPSLPGGANPLWQWPSQTVRDIMTEQAITLTPQDDLSQAIDIMQEGEFRHIPITNEQGKLQGIISDRDILRHLHYAGRRPLTSQKKFREHLFKAELDFVNLKMPLETIMTTKVTHVPPDTSAYTAAKKLLKSKVSSLPVVDDQNNLMGIVTTADLMRTLFTIYGHPAE